jgi:hypothetical protein
MSGEGGRIVTKRLVKSGGIATLLAVVAVAGANSRALEAQRGGGGGGNPPPTTATAMWDNAAGDGVSIQNPTLPMSGEVQPWGTAVQFLFKLPSSGKSKRYLNYLYPSSAFVPTLCDPASFVTSPSGPTGVNVYGAFMAIRSLTDLQIGEARAVVTHFGAYEGTFLWMGETNVGHGCTNFIAAYRIDQRTWRVGTTMDRLGIPSDGEYHGVVNGQIYEGGCRTLTGCQPPLLVTPGSQVVLQADGQNDRHYLMPWGVTVYCETCPPPPSCATWPNPGQPCQFWHNNSSTP